MRITRGDLEAYSPLLRQRQGADSEYPVVAGAEVSVHRIGLLWDSGESPQAIVGEHYPGRLSLAQVFAALSCYCANRQLFAEALEQDEVAL